MAEGKSPTLAFAKTTRPEIGNVVRREGLFARLDGTPGRTVAWIAAPPGFGKSTLAASYVEARDFQSAWYQVDSDDDDVATFFHYLGHATRKLKGRSAKLPAFTPLHADDIASFSRKFFRQLFAEITSPVALVLDNLHDLSESPLRLVLDAGLPQIPKHCCAIVTSRTDPPAALARMRASGEMVYLGAEDLRISPAELADIAALRGHALTHEAMASLQERTQGWAAGLVLMLEHAKIAGRIADLPGDATPDVIFDYFAGEIFDHFEPETQQFLLRIACLPRMTAEVAEALTGEAKGGRLLLNLAHNDYFVREVMAEQGRSFQLHPLLREFLRSRAAQVLPDAVAPAALRRAATLLRRTGHFEDAVALFVECGDWQEVAAVAGDEAREMLAQGRNETLATWLDLLPPQVLEASPQLLYASASSRIHASPRAARRLYEQAFAGFAVAADRRGMMQSCRGVVNAIILEFDDLASLDRWIDELAGLLKESGSGKSVGGDPSTTASLIRALLLRDTGNAELQEWLDRGDRDAASAKGDDVAVELALARATVALVRGDFATASAIAGRIASEPITLNPDMRIALAIETTLHHLLDGAHGSAQRSAVDGLAIATAEGIHIFDEWLRIMLAMAHLGAGDREVARATIQAVEGTGTRLRRGDLALLHYLRCGLAGIDGDTAAANREAKIALTVAVEMGIPWLEWLVRVSVAQLLSSGGDRRGAESQLRGAAALAERLRSPLLRVSVQLAQAAAAHEAGDSTAAAPLLRAALSLAREHGFRHAVGLRLQRLAELCALALTNGIEPEYAHALIRAGRLPPPAAAMHSRQWPWPFRIDMLGGFRLLRDGVPIEFSGKGPGRPMELLKVLVALGGQNVRCDQIADALWPHADADYAHKSFTTTLHRLRRILDAEDALVVRDARLSLNPALFWVDAWAVDQLITEFDAVLRNANTLAAGPALQGLAEELLSLYQGPFLPDESEQPSYIACREQIRSRLLRCLTRMGRSWEEAGRPEAAVDCYLRCIDADELCEPVYRNLMLCYQRQGEPAEALATYERLRTVLAARLKIMPSPETQAIYASLSQPPGNPSRAAS
jgi:ATP/maltotriose-dependent transcriptional regulator MalT/DNA-binding SARP family transcriptional activator